MKCGIGSACNTHLIYENCVQNFGGQKLKRSVARLEFAWECNIKMGRKEWQVTDWNGAFGAAWQPAVCEDSNESSGTWVCVRVQYWEGRKEWQVTDWNGAFGAAWEPAVCEDSNESSGTWVCVRVQYWDGRKEWQVTDWNVCYATSSLSLTSQIRLAVTLINTQNLSETKIVNSFSIRRAETKYGLRIQFLALVFMIHEVWLNA